jgi:hypothetical protein
MASAPSSELRLSCNHPLEMLAYGDDGAGYCRRCEELGAEPGVDHVALGDDRDRPDSTLEPVGTRPESSAETPQDSGADVHTDVVAANEAEPGARIRAALEARSKAERMEGNRGDVLEMYDWGDWPHTWCSPGDVRGWVTRARTGAPGETKAIAKEIGMSWSSVKRALARYLLVVDDYDPDGWSVHLRQYRAERRRRFRERMAKRDQELFAAKTEQRQARAVSGLDLHNDLQIADSYSEIAERKRRTRENQRKLHSKNRARAY